MALNAESGRDEPQEDANATDASSAFAHAATLGLGLRRARDLSGKSLAELATETKVNTRFLIALEQNDWSSLPSRVFAVGYVRAYAAALRLDEQFAVERFKRESPDTSAPLKAPIGIAFEDVRRNSPRIIAGVAVVALAIVGWNVFQRISLLRAPHPSDIVAVPPSWAKGDAMNQGIDLSAPRPAPADQTTPALYVTPGLEVELTGVDPNDPEAVAASAAAATDQTPVQKAFNPRGAVYGAAATASQVVIQANKPGALVVRVGDRQVLFARQMAAGEAWRAPMSVAATVDVSDPAAFDVYLNGEHGGVLPAVLTPLAQLNGRADQMAREMAAQAQARIQAQARLQAQVQTRPAAGAPSPN